MKNFLRVLWRLWFKRHDKAARETKPYNLSQIELCSCDKFTGKPQHYSPDRGWRLLARIANMGTTAKIEQTRDIELDEDTLERIDFLACLFGTPKTG